MDMKPMPGSDVSFTTQAGFSSHVASLFFPQSDSDRGVTFRLCMVMPMLISVVLLKKTAPHVAGEGCMTLCLMIFYWVNVFGHAAMVLSTTWVRFPDSHSLFELFGGLGAAR